MISGITLESAIALVGSKTGTHVYELTRALRIRGIICSNNIIRAHKISDLSKRCLVKATYPEQGDYHWVVYWDKHIYCPAYGKDPKPLPWKIVGYYRIGPGNVIGTLFV
jgi:hypothetical protein